MNFLHISRKFVFIFFAFSCSVHVGPVFSNPHFQELGQPYVRIYVPGPYQYVHQYNSIVFDQDGFLYIGSDKGILRFDGTYWKHIPAAGKVSLISNGSEVFTFGSKEFSCIDRGPDGSPVIRNFSTVDGFTGDIIRTVKAGDDIYILTTNALYHWDGQIEKIDLSFLPEAIFYDGHSLILYSGPHGLMRLEQNTAAQWIPSYELPLEEISAVHRSGDQWIIVDGRENTTAVFEQGSIESGFGSIDQALKTGEFSCIQTLSDGNIAWGTRKEGIIISDSEGQILQSVDRDDGLFDNRVRAIFSDASDNLWVLHDQAVSRVEIPSAFSYYGSNRGIVGNIRDLIRFKGTLYAASNKGLFRLDEFPASLSGIPGKTRFTPVPGIRYECRQLIQTDKTLIAATSNGIFKLEGTEFNHIFQKAVNAICYVAEHDALVVATENEVMLLSGTDWMDRLTISGPDCPIRQIIVTDGRIWLASYYGDIFLSEESLDPLKPPVFNRLNTEALSPASSMRTLLFSLSGEIRFATDQVYLWDADSREFRIDSMIDLSGIEGEYLINKIIEGQDGKLWISIIDPESGMSKAYFALLNEQGIHPLRSINYPRLSQQILNCMYPENNELIWIGGNSGLTRFNPSITSEKAPASHTHITAVTLANDSILSYDYIRSESFRKNHKKGVVHLPHSKNRIRFQYLSTDFNSESRPLFQYKISGLQEQWSDWTGNNIIEFLDLPKRNYTFMVRSQDIFGFISESDSFHFRVMPPFYASVWAFLPYTLLFVFFLYLFQKWRTFQHVRERYRLEEIIEERTGALMEDKEKTDNLLANILPKKTADELKAKGKATSSKFKMVTVLFADIQGFTKIAEQMNPDMLIDELDRFYFQIDSVVEKFNIEKIKTIGDAYMAAGGIPVKNQTNPVEVVLAALEMQHHMQELKKTKADIWDLRIGMHTGSVIAGVVGQKKFSYDIWGDAVNTASRMESSGEIGKVNISATTYELVKYFFDCEYRGKMPVKFKGDIEMYFVNGLKEEFAMEDKHTPNEKFLTQIQLLRLLDLEEYVMQRLNKELSEDLFFHNTEHTTHVYTQVELLGRGEKVSEEDLLTLRTAALLHDIGYIDQFDEHEVRSVELAREILPRFRYSENQINRICDLIQSTKLPPKPDDLLEKIMVDANLDHLGRVDFLIQSDKLFQEYRIRKKIKTKKDWNKFQIDFLNKYDFHTDIARKLREVSKEQQIENIRHFS